MSSSDRIHIDPKEEEISTTVMNKISSFVKKYSIIIALVTYFGVDKGLVQFFKDADQALKNPKTMSEKYSKDSLNFVNRISVLEMRVDRQDQVDKIQDDEITHIMTGVSIVSGTIKDELEIEYIWGYKVYKTNPGNMYVFKADNKYDMMTPLSLQADWHEKMFWYTPIGTSNKTPLEK